MLTIIHGADFHLDAPFAALPPDKARARRAEQRELLDRLAGLAEERRADVVLLSGDLLDGGQTYQETVQALARTLAASVRGEEPALEAEPETADKPRGFVCKICGFVYESDTLPEDFTCPICRRPASDFEPLA